jgi:hypothetical protein
VVEQMMLTFDSGGHAGGISARDIYMEASLGFGPQMARININAD